MNPADDRSLLLLLILGAVVVLAVLALAWWRRRPRGEEDASRWQAVVTQSPVGFLLFAERADGVLVLVEANPAAALLLNGGLPLTAGLPVEELLPGLLGTEVPRRLARIARQGGTATFDGLSCEQEGVSGLYDLAAYAVGPGSVAVSLADAAPRLLLAETAQRRESELEFIAAVVSDGILVLAQDRLVLYANHAACGMCGYTLSELRTLRLDDLLATGEAERLADRLADEEFEPGPWRLRRKDGSAYPAQLSLGRLPDGRLLVAVRDIGPELREEENRRLAACIFEHAREAILITDPAGTIVDVNDAFCAISGYRREDLVGANPRKLQSGRQDAAFYRQMWRTLRETGRWSGEMWNRRRDGEIYAQLNSIVAVRDGRGEITHYVGLSFDITDRKADEKALLLHRDHLRELVDSQVADIVKAKEEAERANRAKSDFLANISHELRTPLHAVLGFADLGGGAVAANPEKAVAYFQSIHAAGERLLALLNDLLDLSRLEAGRVSLHLERLELESIVRAVCGELQSLAETRGIVVRIGVLTDDTHVLGDRRQLGQVVRNLLSNALRFSPEAGAVELSLESDPESPERLRLTVADRGPGVPEAELEAIFDKFVQSSRTRDGSGGTGLGLAICREVAHLHGGSVKARNRIEGGALFEFLLPRDGAAPSRQG